MLKMQKLKAFFHKFRIITKRGMLKKLEKHALCGNGHFTFDEKECRVVRKLIILKYINCDEMAPYPVRNENDNKPTGMYILSYRDALRFPFTDRALAYFEKNGYLRFKETFFGMAMFDILASIGGVAGIISFCKWYPF